MQFTTIVYITCIMSPNGRTQNTFVVFADTRRHVFGIKFLFQSNKWFGKKCMGFLRVIQLNVKRIFNRRLGFI